MKLSKIQREALKQLAQGRHSHIAANTMQALQNRGLVDYSLPGYPALTDEGTRVHNVILTKEEKRQ